MEVPAKASILVMEDSFILSRLYGNVLNRAGYYPYLALTLKDARDLLNSSHRFDAFICDMHMGDNLNIDFLSEMRNLLEYNRTHVVVVSGSDQYESIAREAGVEYFLCKPIDVSTLESLINHLLATPRQPIKA